MSRDGPQYQSKVVRFPSQEPPSFTVMDLARYMVFLLIAVAGFLASYTFYDFGNTLLKVREDISSLQISFAALSEHVKDEDQQRGGTLSAR